MLPEKKLLKEVACLERAQKGLPGGQSEELVASGRGPRAKRTQAGPTTTQIKLLIRAVVV